MKSSRSRVVVRSGAKGSSRGLCGVPLPEWRGCGVATPPSVTDRHYTHKAEPGVDRPAWVLDPEWLYKT